MAGGWRGAGKVWPPCLSGRAGIRSLDSQLGFATRIRNSDLQLGFATQISNSDFQLGFATRIRNSDSQLGFASRIRKDSPPHTAPPPTPLPPPPHTHNWPAIGVVVARPQPSRRRWEVRPGGVAADVRARGEVSPSEGGREGLRWWGLGVWLGLGCLWCVSGLTCAENVGLEADEGLPHKEMLPPSFNNRK